MTDKKVMQMALETLDNIVKVDWREWDEFASVDDFVRWAKSRATFTAEALRSALAQPEPEPFEYWNAVEGWVKIDEVRQHFDTANCGTIYKHEGEGRVPLYAAPPNKEWVALTDDEVDDIGCDFATLGGDIEGKNWFAFYLVIEAKLKEKNTWMK